MSETPTSDEDLTGEPHGTPPGEHDSELPEGEGLDDPDRSKDRQEHNAETTEDQPSQ